MSLKNKDEHNRWRSKTVGFRVFAGGMGTD